MLPFLPLADLSEDPLRLNRLQLLTVEFAFWGISTQEEACSWSMAQLLTWEVGIANHSPRDVKSGLQQTSWIPETFR